MLHKLHKGFVLSFMCETSLYLEVDERHANLFFHMKNIRYIVKVGFVVFYRSFN